MQFCPNGGVLCEICTMVAVIVSSWRSIMMVILDRNMMERTSAALVRIEGIDALATTTTIIAACRRAPHRRWCGACLLLFMWPIWRIRWFGWLLSRSSTVALKFPSAGAMAFHDLTPNKSAPQSAKALLGLGSKFICTPKFTTGSLESNFSRLERDMHLRVFFACGNELDESPEWDKSKLYVKSDWRPSFGDIPVWVDRRLSSFYVR